MPFHFLFLNSALGASAGEGVELPALAAAQGQRPFPVHGDRGLDFLAAARQRSPLDELTVWPIPPLRCGPVPPARSSPRSPAKPEAGPLGIPEKANP